MMMCKKNYNKCRGGVENLKGAGWQLIRELMCLNFRPLAILAKRGDWNKMAKFVEKKKKESSFSLFSSSTATCQHVLKCGATLKHKLSATEKKNATE